MTNLDVCKMLPNLRVSFCTFLRHESIQFMLEQPDRSGALPCAHTCQSPPARAAVALDSLRPGELPPEVQRSSPPVPALGVCDCTDKKGSRYRIKYMRPSMRSIRYRMKMDQMGCVEMPKL
jgi:hypothetical protein